MKTFVAVVTAAALFPLALAAQECKDDPGALSSLQDASAAVRHKSTPTPAKTPEPNQPAEPPAACLAQKTGDPQTSFVPGNDYLSVVEPLIANAKTSIDIHQFNFFTENGAMQQLLNDLIAAKKANPALNISVGLESRDGGTTPDGVEARNALTTKLLDAAGITTYATTGDNNANGTPTEGVAHAKLIVIDGSTVLAGSTNWTNTSTTKNNEVDMLMNGDPAFACAVSSFISDIEKTPGSPANMQMTDGPVTMMTDQLYDAALLNMINSSKAGDTMDYSMYLLDSGDPYGGPILKALVAAAQRGVTINGFMERSSVAGVAVGETKDNKIAAAALIAACGTGAPKGCVTPNINFCPPTIISHAKFIELNGQQVLMGSSNWSQVDEQENHQVDWLINNPTMAGQMASWVMNLIATEGTPASQVVGTTSSSKTTTKKTRSAKE